MTHYQLSDLNFGTAFDVIPSQDPAISTRYYVPIPNWLSEVNGAAPHENLQNIRERGWRFIFHNPTDQREQRAQIDGTEVVACQTTFDKAVKLHAFICKTYGDNPNELKPEDLCEIIRYAQDIEIHDIYDDKISKIPKYMHKNPDIETDIDGFGAYLPNPDPVAAIYLSGRGSYVMHEGAVPQIFGNGGYVSFPGLVAADVVSQTPAGIQTLVEEDKMGIPRFIQAHVFEWNRTFPDGRLIKAGKAVELANASLALK